MNYQRKLEEQLNAIDGSRPALLLHCCCAPCSSYVLEYLSNYFAITLYYDNPNIWPQEEYDRRGQEVKRLVSEMPTVHPVKAVIAPYDPQAFAEIAAGKEEAPEGGERCFACYRLRMRRAADYAQKCGFDYFTTTLSISPHKNAQVINQIGEELSGDVRYLYGDFKKKNGYLRSITLSETYHLYRQDYCGCIYAKRNLNN